MQGIAKYVHANSTVHACCYFSLGKKEEQHKKGALIKCGFANGVDSSKITVWI